MNQLHQETAVKSRTLPASFGSLEEAIAAIAMSEGVPKHVAMSKARTAYPQLYERYQAEGEGQIAKHGAAEAALNDVIEKHRLETQGIDLAVVGIAKCEGCSRVEAMRRWRKRNPEAFYALRGN
jgi:hypothetical protein